ncbi:MAG: hypothetical protein ACE5F9_14850 [Phycisphaerae bacterium]
MLHSSPMPLNIALDIAKRLHHELTGHMTPEQRRDFARVERLIHEAQTHHKTEVSRLRHSLSATATAREPSRRKGFWRQA